MSSDSLFLKVMRDRLTVLRMGQKQRDSAVYKVPDDILIHIYGILKSDYIRAVNEPPTIHNANDDYKSWSKDGLLHREYGLPAKIHYGEWKTWAINGRIYREETPQYVAEYVKGRRVVVDKKKLRIVALRSSE